MVYIIAIFLMFGVLTVMNISEMHAKLHVYCVMKNFIKKIILINHNVKGYVQ